MLFYQLPARHSLSTKLMVLVVAWTLLASIAIGTTLILSWKLEGGAAAINDAGSLRMRTYRTVLMMADGRPEADILREKQAFTSTLERLRRGDPARPLFLPDNTEVKAQAERIARQWQYEISPLITRHFRQAELYTLRPQPDVTPFVDNINHLVKLIEEDNARNTALLRTFQMALLAMALAGSVSMIYLLFLLVIQPLTRLGEGIQRLRDGDLACRVEVEGKDEFGALSAGFNQMADRLQDLYGTLEQKVRDKTRSVEDKNRQLSALYGVTSFLHETQELEATCEGFIRRLITLTGADAGSVRLVDLERGKLDQVFQIGLPDELADDEACIPIDGCHCGEAVAEPFAVIHRFDQLPQEAALQKRCHAAGFAGISVFHIRHNHQDVGIFTLYFRDGHTPGEQELLLLETLGSHLGVAIENRRLAARERQYAVSEERNLMAQGLHDSIAQSLSFLNLQVQMLESALASGEREQASENLAFIRDGVQECYEDVRELLLNFRTRISRQDFPDAVRTLVERFQRQTQVEARLEMTGDGLPLDPQQQLQVIFILQEALSNVRKHAEASRVSIQIHNDHDFVMTIHDNGRGFDAAQVAEKKLRHVGMSIMEERARRIRSRVHIHSVPGSGTTLELLLPKEERLAA